MFMICTLKQLQQSVVTEVHHQKERNSAPRSPPEENHEISFFHVFPLRELE